MIENELRDILREHIHCLEYCRFYSSSSKGKRCEEVELITEFMDPFEGDFTKLLCSKSLRLLDAKTQVYSLPIKKYVRTRAIHTNEVLAFSIRAAKLLGLNTWLCASISLGHDIGHLPFGHLGENFVSEKTGKQFEHKAASVILADRIERSGNGLNCSYETLQGIYYHSISSKDKLSELPQEYHVVMLGDKITYVLSDLNDAVTCGTITEKQIPEAATFLGKTQRIREERCLVALTKESAETGRVSFEKSDEAKAIFELRDWLFENVYYPSNKKILKVQLEEAWNWITQIDEFKEYDPTLILLHLTDKEVTELAELAMRLVKPSKQATHWLTIWEILDFLPKNTFYNFNHLDLNPNDFHPLN